MRSNDLYKWMRERHKIYCARQKGKDKPWTRDTILQRYRFCNVYRELDAVTKWITKNWRTPHYNDDHLWFAMVVARLLNLPATLDALGYPVPWNAKHFLDVLARRHNAGQQIFNGAYIVSTNGNAMSKPLYLATRVLDPIWDARKHITIRYKCAETLNEFHQVLMQYDGLGSFMAAQVIADVKYVAPLAHANDWHSWAASGPGSRRGLNRVMKRPIDTPWSETEWLETLQRLHSVINARLEPPMPKIDAQDLQNCLCEFDKYERAKFGEGRPKSTFAGK